jgi:hypothetical protein
MGRIKKYRPFLERHPPSSRSNFMGGCYSLGVVLDVPALKQMPVLPAEIVFPIDPHTEKSGRKASSNRQVIA